MKKKSTERKVTFVFDNDNAADNFLSWLSNSGEQEYWEAMRYQDEEDQNDTVTFDYWGKDEKSEFGKGDIICKSRGPKEEDEDADDEIEDQEYEVVEEDGEE